MGCASSKAAEPEIDPVSGHEWIGRSPPASPVMAVMAPSEWHFVALDVLR